MAKKDDAKKPKSVKPKSAPQSVDLSVGGNVDKSVVTIGDNNVINYYAAVSTNTEKHEPDYWNLKHPYPMPPNFTGRLPERVMLTQWLADDSENRLFILRALGGFGKSALTWHWLTHDIDPKEWPKLVFWSFYEGDASFEHFIEETLRYLKIEVPQGGRPQVDELLKAMQTQKILLIMDGFERVLRAYSSMNAAYQGEEEPKLEENQLDCVNINAEIFLKSVCSLPNMKGKVLMTTRLTPHAVKPHGEFLLGCREEELAAMQKEDAVEFFHKQKIKGTHAEIEAACAPYGFHPLSLRLLIGRILKDFENPADIVVAQKLKIDGDTVQQKHHVLEVSYNSLPPHEQKLLSTIACFRSPVELKTLQSITESEGTLDDNLHDLVERGLLHFDEKNKKFDLHPIVRRYAYERLAAPDRITTHTQLRDYFGTKPLPNVLTAQSMRSLAPVVELYHHTINTGQFEEAAKLVFFLFDPPWFEFDDYNARISLLNALSPSGIDSLPQLKDRFDQALVISKMAECYSSIGQTRLAIMFLERAIDLWQDTYNIALDLSKLASEQLNLGELITAERNLKKAIKMLVKNKDSIIVKALMHQELEEIFIFEGRKKDYEREHRKALRISSKEQLRGHIIFHAHLNSVRQLLLMDATNEALPIANQAKEMAIDRIIIDNINFHFPDPEEVIQISWLLGSVLMGKDLDAAHKYLVEALMICRSNNIVKFESIILLTLAKWCRAQHNMQEAKSLAEEALLITERCGYVLQGADVNLFLAQYALEQEKDKVKAKEYAESALKLATCDGPPYYYKVAYEEAERMLEKLK